MQLLYIAKPRTIPMRVNCPSVSYEDGLNQKNFVDSSYVNMPAGRKTIEYKAFITGINNTYLYVKARNIVSHKPEQACMEGYLTPPNSLICILILA